MAITVVGTSEAETTSTATSVALSLPANLQQGDVVYALGVNPQTSDTTLSESSGTWTKLADIKSNDSRDINLGLFRKVMGASPDSSITIQHSGSAMHWCAGAVAYRGVDTTTPEDVSVVTFLGNNTGNPNGAAITPTSDGCNIVVFGGSTATISGANISAPTGYTARVHNPHSVATNLWAVIADRTLDTAGTTDPGNWVISTSSTSDSYAVVTVALRPAAAPTGSVSQTLGALTASATGKVANNGVLNKTLDALTLSATATLPAASISGELDVTLSSLTASIVLGSVEETEQDARVIGCGIGAMGKMRAHPLQLFSRIKQ